MFQITLVVIRTFINKLNYSLGYDWEESF